MVTSISNTSKAQETSFSGWTKLPQPVMFQIFFKMNMSDLCRCANVSKQWKVMADNPRLWEAIARTQVLGKRVWEETRVGDVGIEPEYKLVSFNGMDGEELPWKEVCKMHKKPFSYRDPLKKLVMIKMPEFDFLVPATINGHATTINLVREVFKEARLPIGCSIYPDILTKYGDVPIEKSYFARHTWTVVNETRQKEPDVRVIKINEKKQQLYRLPKIIEMIIFQFLSYQAGIESGYGQDPWTWSQCVETLTVNGKECPIYAGAFKKPAPDAAGGLHVTSYVLMREHCGTGGLREF